MAACSARMAAPECSSSAASSSSSSQRSRLLRPSAAAPLAAAAARRGGRRAAPRCTRASVSQAQAQEAKDNDDDLWQIPNRDLWYHATWCATDQPDFNPARFVRATQLAPGVREVVLEVEISRERVPLRNAYKAVGQRASVRVNSGAVVEVSPAAPPFPQELNKAALLRVRGDILAGEVKTGKKEELSVLVELPLLVQEDAAPELYKASADDALELGPFVGSGLALRGPISAVFRYPTVVMFCEGGGIAAAKALIEATPDQGGLSFRRRGDVRMYYRAPNEMALCWRDQFEEWGAQRGVQVITSTRDTFLEMFDDDQTLMYDPDTTAAMIFTGGDEEAEAAAAEVCKEAEITVVVKQSEEAEATEYLLFGKPREEA